MLRALATPADPPRTERSLRRTVDGQAVLPGWARALKPLPVSKRTEVASAPRSTAPGRLARRQSKRTHPPTARSAELGGPMSQVGCLRQVRLPICPGRQIL